MYSITNFLFCSVSMAIHRLSEKIQKNLKIPLDITSMLM
nr:MAG TPA_asm: hypothetical protein [Caudoviricetes sp.]